MKDHQWTPKEARTKAEKLLASVKTTFMATNGSYGHPNVRAMRPIRIEGCERVWFTATLESSKIIELIKDSRATLYGSAANRSEFRLWGNVSVLDDPESRAFVWNDELKKFFEGGPEDPLLRVLRFDVVSGMYRGKEGKKGNFKI